MIPLLSLLILFWFVLMPRGLDAPNYRYTVRPWVKVGLPPMQTSSNASKADGPTLTCSSTEIMHNHCGATIRVVEGTITSVASNGGVLTRRDASNTTVASHTAKSLSFRNKDKTTPTRPRGKTVPADHKPLTPERERERDGDRDSVISFTPSVSSRHLANWFSGLLGK
jgi:hypothetical protein